jgi:uncharacterized membrane protein
MILSIFTLWLIAAFVLSFYGWYAKTDMHRFFGAALFVVLGLIVSPTTSAFGSLEYVTGQVETVVSNVTTVTYTYATFSSHVIGFYLALLGALSIFVIYFDRREVSKE